MKIKAMLKDVSLNCLQPKLILKLAVGRESTGGVITEFFFTDFQCKKIHAKLEKLHQQC